MKTCKDCNFSKPYSDFTPKASCTDGYEIRCKVCRSIRYNKSNPALLAKKVYNTQIQHAVGRGHPAPDYDLATFTLWLTTQTTFDNMFAEWVASGYEIGLAPSADRLDNAKPYTLDNLELVPWSVNRQRAADSKKIGELYSGHRAVAAYNKDGSLFMQFVSLAEALRHFGVKPTQSWGLATVANKEQVRDGRGKLYTPRSYKGYRWEWV